MFKVVNKPMDKAIDRNSVSVFSADIDLLNRKFPFRQDFANGFVGQFVLIVIDRTIRSDAF